MAKFNVTHLLPSGPNEITVEASMIGVNNGLLVLTDQAGSPVFAVPLERFLYLIQS